MALQCTYSSNCGPFLVMLIQPETKTRFRYESEGGSHGVLTGKEKVGGKKKTYPTVKLENYSESFKDIFIRVSLCTEKKTEHVMTFKKKKFSGNHNHVDENLTEDYTAEFKNLTIISKKKEEIYQALMDKKFKSLGRNPSKNARDKCERENSEAVKKEAKDILNSVILCFDAFERRRPDVHICASLYSERICNQKASSKGDLKIHRMSKVSGSWKGEEEVILLCDKVQKDNIKILFYEKDVENGWKAYATFNKGDIHYQVAIPFKTPRYKMNAEKEVAVALERDDELSEPRIFTYIPDDYPSKKRKMCVPNMLSSPLAISSAGSSTTAMSDDSSQESMQALGDLKISQMQGNESYFGSFENFSSDSDPYLLGDSELINILPEEIFADLPDLNENINAIGDQGIDQNFYVNMPLFPFDIQIDGGNLVGQMACMGIGDQKSAHDIPISNDQKESESLENRKERLKKNLHLILKKDKCGNTLLHLAVLHNKSIGIIMLMNEMANSDIINVQNCYGQTTLHIAVGKNSDVVKHLLIKGGDPNIKNADGNNCYHIASQNNFDRCMRNLRYSRFPHEVNEFNYEGLTPLHITIMKNSSDCFDILRRNFKADLKVREQKCGRSLLHYAAEYQRSFILPILKEAEIDVNIQDFEGNTPLHIACSKGDYDTVKELLLAKANPLIRNLKQSPQDSEEESSDDETPVGQTPADLTTDQEILELLKQASKKDRSDPADSGDNSGSETLLKNICSLLDSDKRWEAVATYVLDERYFDSLKCSSTPTKTLLEYMERQSGEGYIESFKAVLEMVGFNDVLQIIREQ